MAVKNLPCRTHLTLPNLRTRAQSSGLVALVWLLAGCGRFGFDAHIVELDGDAAVSPPGPGDGDGAPRDGGRADAAAAGDGDGSGDGDGDGGADSPMLSDAATQPDTQNDAASLPLSCSDYLVCSGFEGAADETPYQQKSDLLSVIGTANGQVHGGSLALRAATVQENDQATVEFTLPGISSGDLYARAWILAPLGTVTGRINVLYLGSTAEDGGVDVNINGNGALDLYFRQRDVRSVSAAGVVPQTRWFCLQIHMKLDDSAGDVEAWVPAMARRTPSRWAASSAT